MNTAVIIPTAVITGEIPAPEPKVTFANELQVKFREIAILDTLRSIQKKYKLKYCFPKQKTILKFLREIHGIYISLRTLNYTLKAMCEKKLIYRIRRLTKERFKSTVYYILDYPSKFVSQVKQCFHTAKRVFFHYPSRLQNIANNAFKTKKQHIVCTDSKVSARQDIMSKSVENKEKGAFNEIIAVDSALLKGITLLKSIGLKVPERFLPKIHKEEVNS